MTTTPDIPVTAAPRAIAVIIGRAGSRGLPDKNALPLLGRPMICYSIDAAVVSTTVGRVVVSTDGSAIAEAATTTGVDVVMRPAHLACDTARVDDAVRHAVTELHATEPVVVMLYANVPVRPDGLIDLAVRTLAESGADSVQSYAPVGKHHPHWMVELEDGGGVVPLRADAPHRRQDLPALFLPDGGVIAVTRDSLFAATDADHPHAFLGRDRRGVKTAAGAVIDIDGPSDLARAEAALRTPPAAPSRTLAPAPLLDATS